MSEYRLEACACCDVVRLAMKPAPWRGSGYVEWIGETPVYRVDFCPACRRAYEASFPQQTEGGDS